MIFFLIGILILLYSIKDYKGGLTLYLAYKIILVTNITIISIPGIPLLTLEMFLTLAFIIMFFVKGKKHQYAHMPFPYRIPFAMLCFCWCVSALFAIAGFGAEVSNLIKSISEEIILIWIMWEIYETRDDFEKLYKCITAVILVSCLYAFVEFAIQQNPLVLYEASLNRDESKIILSFYSTASRGYRVQSIFEHAIGAGINWGLYAIFSIRLWIDSKKQSIFSKVCLITAFLCIVCVILTKMRSGILFTAIAGLSLIDFKKKRFYMFVLLAIIGMIVIYPIISENIALFLSFFSENAQQTVSGSSFEMRIEQFKVAFNLVGQSPIVGLGNKYENVLPASSYSGLLGSESVWLGVIVELGGLGVAIYIIYVLYSTIIIPRRFKSQSMLFIASAFWITYTASSLPGMKLHLYFLVMIYYMKNSNKYQIAKTQRGVYGVYFTKGKIKYNLIKGKEDEEY